MYAEDYIYFMHAEVMSATCEALEVRFVWQLCGDLFTDYDDVYLMYTRALTSSGTRRTFTSLGYVRAKSPTVENLKVKCG